MAYAKTNNVAKARNHLAQLRIKQQDSILKIPYRPYMSSPLECSEVAEYILESNIAFAQKNYKDALASIKKAIAAEDKLIYSEPNTWILPARQYLGTFLLKMKQAGEAEKVFREDLVWNPGNGWSLLGLHQALEAQNKTKELSKLKALYTNSFSEAEKIPALPAY
jgi:tetratricopeptide (TPR) repeat protein